MRRKDRKESTARKGRRGSLCFRLGREVQQGKDGEESIAYRKGRLGKDSEKMTARNELLGKE